MTRGDSASPTICRISRGAAESDRIASSAAGSGRRANRGRREDGGAGDASPSSPGSGAKSGTPSSQADRSALSRDVSDSQARAYSPQAGQRRICRSAIRIVLPPDSLDIAERPERIQRDQDDAPGFPGGAEMTGLCQKAKARPSPSVISVNRTSPSTSGSVTLWRANSSVRSSLGGCIRTSFWKTVFLAPPASMRTENSTPLAAAGAEGRERRRRLSFGSRAYRPAWK